MNFHKNLNHLNTFPPTLPSVNTPLSCLQWQSSVHFKTEQVILNRSTKQSSTNNQNIQLTPQQLVNIVRPTYTKQGFLDAIKKKVMTAGPDQVDSPHHDAWLPKRIAMMQIALHACH